MAKSIHIPEENGDGDFEFLKPENAKAKIEKVKTTKPKVTKPKAEKAEKVPKEKVFKPKVEKAEKAVKAEDANAAPKAAPKVAPKVAAADKPVKVKTVNGDEAVALMVEYLKSQNRPYSATQISENLHGRVTKTVADKLLKDMGEARTLGMHATNGDKKGSQFVFWTLQDPADDSTPEELVAMDERIDALKTSIPSLRSTHKAHTARLTALKSARSVSELQVLTSNLQASNAEKREKLESFKNGFIKQVSKEEKDKVEKEFKYWGKMKEKRRRAYQEAENTVCAGMNKDREELRDELGIEGL